MADHAIEIRGLTKRFGDFPALKGFDLTVPRGMVFGFLGPNGAGKTTTLRIMTGLARATSGTVTIEGVRVGGPHRPPIGYLPDTPSFYNWMTAPEFLRYIADLHGLADPPITALLERVGLGDTGRRTIGGFSRGMKQRLGLAQALLPQPAVLLLDEPASALDPAGRREVLDIMSDLRGELTIFFSTHILNDAERICDAVGILHQGELLLQARREELLARFAQPIFEIDVTPDDVGGLTALAAQIGAEPWAERVQQNGTRLRIGVRDVPAARRALLPLLADRAVLRVEMVGATLEDVFLRLTNGAESSAGEAA
ncbi:MAG TPA: ABC transporter ATP-binding protein [Aggregatilineaceae bacterium]|nr:ABC transporter ATP-binding protein [Anaerolineae bacterium]HMM29587.1 ABC transporter ATP-binding protein [Aggregatilineaceae bacterium]